MEIGMLSHGKLGPAIMMANQSVEKLAGENLHKNINPTMVRKLSFEGIEMNRRMEASWWEIFKNQMIVLRSWAAFDLFVLLCWMC